MTRTKLAFLIVGISIFIGPAFAEDAGKQISGDEIVKALGGHKVDAVTLKGKKWGEEYREDGTVISAPATPVRGE